MKRTVFLLAGLILAVACNEADKARVKELQQELDELQRQAPPGVPAAEVVVPEDGSFFFTFDKEGYGVDAGGSVTICYSLQEEAAIDIEVVGDKGWDVSVNSIDAT